MKLSSLIIPTGMVHPGTTVAEVFREWVAANVPGIPFQDANGNITGKASIRHVFKENCIPDFMVQHAHLLGNNIQHLLTPDSYVREALAIGVGLGGNATHIGATANIIYIAEAGRSRYSSNGLENKRG